MIFKRKPLDYILNDIYDEITMRNLHSFELLLDTVDYVPPRFLKKFQKDIFKLYKRQRRQAKAEANRLRKDPPKTPDTAPQDEQEPPKTIPPDLIQISNTGETKAINPPADSWELDFAGCKGGKK